MQLKLENEKLLQFLILKRFMVKYDMGGHWGKIAAGTGDVALGIAAYLHNKRKRK